MKNSQFLAYQTQTLAILPIHEIVILTKFHNNWTKIVDFSLVAYFRASLIFYASVFSVTGTCNERLTLNTQDT